MDKRLEKAYKTEVNCLVCGKSDEKILGTRGNREYTDADQNAEPHLFTNVVQCRNCGFIYTNPQINGIEFLEAEYYNNPEEYQSDVEGNVAEMYLHRLAFIKSFVSRGSLLDVGAGKGEFVAAAGSDGFDAVGVEPSPRFCEFAKKHFQAEIYNGRLETCEELKNRKFDVITLHHVFEHVENPHELLENLKDFLNEGGILYLEVPNTQSITAKLIDAYFRLRGKNWSSRLSPLHPPFHKFGYNAQSLNFILRKHNYEPVKIATFPASSRDFGKNLQTASLRNYAFRAVVAAAGFLGNRDMLAFVARKGDGNEPAAV